MKPQSQRRSFARGLLAAVLLAALPATAPALAGDADTAADLVDESTLAIRKMLRDDAFEEVKPYIDNAYAVLIFPTLVKGGLIVGGEGGTGVLLVRGDDNSWSPPAFYTLAAGSVGLQIGGQVSSAVFTVMNQGALDSVLQERMKLGGDASVAVGPVGKGIEAATTTNLDADIYAFSRNVGLFAGGSLEGSLLFVRETLNDAYYGTSGVTPQEIVIERRYFNAGADNLRATVP